MRLVDRRRVDLSSPAPLLSKALRHLRLIVIDTFGEDAVDRFVAQAQAVASLAQQREEPAAARALTTLSALAMRNRTSDLRPVLYEGLDRVERALRVYH